MKITTIILFIVISSFTRCGIHINGKGPVVSHDKWTALVEKHVGIDGLVDYQGFIKDKNELQSYLDILSENAPAKSWNENDKIAYWLNAYNAFGKINYKGTSKNSINPSLLEKGMG